MKIFPLKLMSNYEKYKNLAEIMVNIQSPTSNCNKYRFENKVNACDNVKQYSVHELFKRYKPVIKEFLSKFKGTHV